MFNPSDNFRRQPSRSRQHGASLIELLVGVTVGLMVVVASLATLVLSRTTSQAVSDQLELQQQANMAMRIISQQLRESGTREVVHSASVITGVVAAGKILPGMVLFSSPPAYAGNAGLLSVQGLARDALDNDNFGVSFADAGAPTPTQDCLGNTNTVGSALFGIRVDNQFFVNTGRLMCMGTNAGTGAQPLISDVRRFRVLYGIQNGAVIPTTTTYLTQAAVPDWTTANVVALEMCLELASIGRASTVVGTYVDCDGNVVAQDGAVRAVARQVVRLRAVPLA